MPSPEPVVTHWISVDQRLEGAGTRGGTNAATPLDQRQQQSAIVDISAAHDHHMLRLPSYARVAGEYVSLKEVSTDSFLLLFLLFFHTIKRYSQTSYV